MTQKPKRKSKQKRSPRAFYNMAFLSLLIISLIVGFAFSLFKNRSRVAATAQAEAAAQSASENCYFSWANRQDNTARENISVALSSTAIAVSDVQVRQNGETYCSDFLVMDVDVTINLYDVPEDELTDAIEIIVSRLPDITYEDKATLTLSFLQSNETELMYQTSYADIRRAYTEGLRGEDLRAMLR